MTIKTKIISFLLIAAAVPALAGGIAYAQDKTVPEKETKRMALTIPKPKTLPGLTSSEQKEMTGKEHVGTQLLPKIANMFVGFAGILCFIFLIIGGIQFLTAYGNEEALGSAKKTVTFSIVGLLISLFAYAIVALLSGLQLEPKKETDTAETAFIPAVETAYAEYKEEEKIGGEELLPKIHGGENVKNLPFANMPEDIETQKELTGYMVGGIYGAIAKLALGIASILIVISFVAAGALYVTAQGNEDQMSKAKNILIYTLIAVAVTASAYAVTLGVMKLKEQFWQGGAVEEQTK